MEYLPEIEIGKGMCTWISVSHVAQVNAFEGVAADNYSKS